MVFFFLYMIKEPTINQLIGVYYNIFTVKITIFFSVQIVVVCCILLNLVLITGLLQRNCSANGV